MRRATHRTLHCLAIVACVALLATGCARGPSEEEQKQAQLNEQLSAIQQSAQELNQARADLEAAQAELTELEAVPERQLTDEQTQRLEELPASIEQLEAQLESQYEPLQTQLQEFLNFALNELPQDPATAEGLKIYADEAILVADEMVATSGQYSKAIEKLKTVEGYFTDIGAERYQPLADKLAWIDDWQYITQERFDAVTKGMTEQEVKDTAGVPNQGNIREDSERGVSFWLYPKREGGAAAIYFDKKGKVYNKNLDAVKTKVVQD
jgi:hypothetical protein